MLQPGGNPTQSAAGMEFRHQRIRQVFWLGLAVSLLMFFSKLLVGLKLRSLAVLADGIFSLFEGISAGMGLITVYAAAAPPEPSLIHRRRKFEILTSILLSGPLFLCGWEILGSSFERLLLQTIGPVFSWWGVLFLLGALGIQYGLSGYKKNRADILNDRWLAAYAAQGKTAFLCLGTALAGLIVTRMGWPRFDACAAIVIVIFICVSSYALLDRSIENAISGHASDPAKQNRVQDESRLL